MLFSLIGLLVLGIATATITNPQACRRVTFVTVSLLIVALLVLAATGLPLMRERVGHANVALTAAAESRALNLHRVIGRVAESMFSFAWPSLLILPFRLNASRPRLFLAVAIAALVLVLFGLVAVSAYMLPPASSETLPTPLAATILRFAIFHVTLGPALVTVLLIAAMLLVRGRRQVAPD